MPHMDFFTGDFSLVNLFSIFTPVTVSFCSVQAFTSEPIHFCVSTAYKKQFTFSGKEIK